MKEAYIVYKSQYDGMELLFCTENSKVAKDKVIELQNEITKAKERMKSINEEFGTEEDEDYWTHYDRMYISKEISHKEYNDAKYMNIDDFGIQKWNGENFEHYG